MSDHTEILSSFPGPVVLASPKAYLWHFLGCVILVALMIYLYLAAPIRDWVFLWLIAFAALMIFCAAIFAIMMSPGVLALKLDADGFEITKFFRKRRVAWKDATDFTVWEHRGISMVTFNEANKRVTWLARLNGMSTKRNSYLPATANYGLPAQVLADVMTAWRERALRA